MNKPKVQGTSFETWIVNWANAVLGFGRAERLAEGGSKDEGDVRINLPFERWYVEAKATQTLNVTRVLGKAREKSPDPKRTVLMWKRLVKLKDGQKKRRPDGEKIVVVMGLDTYELLMQRTKWIDETREDR